MSVVRLESTDGNANILTLINCLKNPKVQEAYFLRETSIDGGGGEHALVALLVHIEHVDDLVVLVETDATQLNSHLGVVSTARPSTSRWFYTDQVLEYGDYRHAHDVMAYLQRGADIHEVKASLDAYYRICGI